MNIVDMYVVITVFTCVQVLNEAIKRSYGLNLVSATAEGEKPLDNPECVLFSILCICCQILTLFITP